MSVLDHFCYVWTETRFSCKKLNPKEKKLSDQILLHI